MEAEEIKFYSGNWRMRAYMKNNVNAESSPFLQPESLSRLLRLVQEEETTGEESQALPKSVLIERIIKQALNLFAVKNEEYGNSIDRTGLLGAVVAMTGDIARLRQMVIRHPQHGQQDEDNVRDKLLDVLVEAAIGILMLDSENWIGED